MPGKASAVPCSIYTLVFNPLHYKLAVSWVKNVTDIQHLQKKQLRRLGFHSMTCSLHALIKATCESH